MNKTDELKPCPFCGSTYFARSVDGGIPPDYEEVYAKYVVTCTLYCDECHAQVQGYAASDTSNEGLYQDAIAACYTAWNMRVYDDVD